jgi:hypothetical protein
MWLLNFLSPKRILYIVGALVLAFLVWQGARFIDAKYEAEAQVVALEQVVKERELTIEVMRLQAEQKQSAENAADAAEAALELLGRGYGAIFGTIENVKDEDDGEIAPVLRNTLRQLDGLQPAEGN